MTRARVRHTLRRPSTAILLVVTLTVVLLAALGIVRKVSSFQSAGVELELRKAGWTVTEVAAGSELEDGDVLVLVNGAEVSPTDDRLVSRLRDSRTSAVVVLRGGELHEVRHRLPPLNLDYTYLVLALIGATYLFIGLYTLLRGRGQKLVLFHTWCLTSAALYLVSPLLAPRDGLDHVLYLLDAAARLLLPVLTLHFFLRFPRPLGAGSRVLRSLIPFLYLPPAVLWTIQLDWSLFDGRYLVGAPSAMRLWTLDRLELFLFIAYALAAIASLITQSTRTQPGEQRRQVLWITLGMVCGYLPFLALYVLPFVAGLHTPPALELIAVLPLAFVPLSFAWALLRYRLWDIAIIVRDVTTYTLTLLFGALGFSLLQLVIRRGIPADLELTRNLSTVAGGVLVAGLMVPTKRSIGATLERFHYRGSFSRRRQLTELGDELLYERDLETLCNHLREQIEDAMGLEACNIYLAEEARLVPITTEPASWQEPDLRLDVFGDDFWERGWTELEPRGLPDLESAELDTLYRRGYRTALPLTVRRRRVGMLLAGAKEGRVPLSSEDLLLIRQVLNQAALAIENAQLLEQMQRQLREVLELKQFNEEIIESSPAGIAVLDDRGRIVSSNVAFSALVGIDRGGLRHRPVREVLPLEELPTPEEPPHDLSFEDARGRSRQVQVSAASLFGQRSAGMRVLVAHDVTDIVNMEKALQERERLASLGALAAGVAHEVNTPLTGISSYAQMLLDRTPETDPRHDILRKVEKQTFRAARIVNSLLALSRGPANEESHPISVRQAISEVLELLDSRIKRAKASVDCSRVPEDAVVLAGEGEIAQILTNLVTNATDALSSNGGDGGSIRFEYRRDNGHGILSVVDDGPGISQRDLKRVFDPFFSTKVGNGGTGLGLSISQGIAQRLGGDLLVSSEAGSGCRFELRLPLEGNGDDAGPAEGSPR